MKLLTYNKKWYPVYPEVATAVWYVHDSWLVKFNKV